LDLLNLDVRDFEVWLRAAQRKEIKEKIHDLRMSRMGWAESKDVKEEMDRLMRALEMIDGPKPKHYAKTWTEALRKGKG
jgi:hypothetical protein